MLYKTTSVESLFRRIQSFTELQDNVFLNIVEWSGWALKEVGFAAQLAKVTKRLTAKRHKIAVPSDLFSLIQICYNGIPLNYSDESFKYDYLLCDDCVRNYGYDSTVIEQHETNIENLINDYTSESGVQTVYINQVVKVTQNHVAGGTPGNYYRRVNSDLAGMNLSAIDYTEANWNNVTSEAVASRVDAQVGSGYINPYNAYYDISPGWINTSFEEGTVQVSYYQMPVDSRGFPMIPDNEAYLNYLEYYNKVRLIQKGYDFREENLQVCKMERDKFRRAAKAQASGMTNDQAERFIKRWTRPLAIMDRHRTFYKPDLEV